MPIMQQLILKVPLPVLGLIFVGAGVLYSIIGVLIVHRFVHHSKLKAHHDIADPMLGAIAAVYSVLIAFVVITVWISFDKSNSSVQLEANYLADIYRDSEGLSRDFHQEVAKVLREYRQAVINYEWKTMARGEMSPEVEEIMKKIWALYTTYQPKTPTEQSFFDESVRKLNSFRELRRQRIMDARSGIEPLLWLVLIVGGLSTISFTFFFGTENIKAHIIMAALLSLTIFLILFTVMEMDYPFTGNVAVSSEPFKSIILD